MALTSAGWAQDNAEVSPAPPDPTSGSLPTEGDTRSTGHFPELLKDFVQDQKHIWTSPARFRYVDANWLVPLGGIAAGLLVTDRGYSASLTRQSSTIRHFKTLSNVGVGSLVVAGAGMYLFSFPAHSDHWRETGWLAGDAALNSLLVTETLKYSMGRQRPYQGTGAGGLFQSGTSFPSEHAAAAWSIAGVIAHEYPGLFPKLFAYGAAAAVDYSRVHARQHFPADVLVGSVLGYLAAQSIYSRRVQPELGGRSWDAPKESIDEERTRSPQFMGSPYVPPDSWIYPALERLAALGYVGTDTLGLRPWTRLECARLVNETAERAGDTDTPAEVQQLYGALSRELGSEFELMDGERNLGLHAESVYERSLGISGRPLTDNHHFGQTLLNDYGRPYEQGFNSVAGASGWATAGPFVIYARGEYESAPSAPALAPTALNFISSVDGLPQNAPSLPTAAISRLRLLDAYVGMNLANWQFTYGRRSLWWGPSEGGTMLFTNNAAPLNNMFSVDRVSPFRLPWLFGLLGEIRLQGFIGQLSGQEFLSTLFSGQTGPPTIIGEYGHALNPQPYLSGEKIAFKFTPNFELALSKTTIYGGPGNPLTPITFLESTFGKHVHGDVLGDGRTAAEFSYRVPKLRDWMTVYGEAFSEDEISPLAYMGKSIFQGGVYLARLPRIPRLDLRLEGGSTSPVDGSFCTSCFYSNGQYVNGYTNDGQAIGTWIGRASQGELIRTTYWLSPQRKIALEVRHRKLDREYIPQGGTQNDFALNADFYVGPGVRLSGNLQYERWQIPLLATDRQSNVAASVQIGIWPVVRGH